MPSLPNCPLHPPPTPHSPTSTVLSKCTVLTQLLGQNLRFNLDFSPAPLLSQPISKSCHFCFHNMYLNPPTILHLYCHHHFSLVGPPTWPPWAYSRLSPIHSQTMAGMTSSKSNQITANKCRENDIYFMMECHFIYMKCMFLCM